MSTEENKSLVRRFYEEVFNKKNLAEVNAFVDPQIVEHDLPPDLSLGAALPFYSECGPVILSAAKNDGLDVTLEPVR